MEYFYNLYYETKESKFQCYNNLLTKENIFKLKQRIYIRGVTYFLGVPLSNFKLSRGPVISKNITFLDRIYFNIQRLIVTTTCIDAFSHFY